MFPPFFSGVSSVVVLTYMRSGSSLTGDILQHTNDTFYVFEPYRSLYTTLKSKPIQYLNGTVRLVEVTCIATLTRNLFLLEKAF